MHYILGLEKSWLKRTELKNLTMFVFKLMIFNKNKKSKTKEYPELLINHYRQQSNKASI